MKGHGKIWIIYDAVKKEQSAPLPTLQAQVVLLKVRSARDPERYFLWTPGWKEWMSLPKFLETNQTTFVLAPAPIPRPDLEEKTVVLAPEPEPEPPDDRTKFIDDEASDIFTAIVPMERPPKKEEYGYYYEDFGIDKVDPEFKSSMEIRLPRKTLSAADRRAARRVSVKLEVILINDSGITFRTDSLDISIGGTMLRDELPKDFINRRFDVILINKFEKDPAKGRVHIQSRVVGDYRNPRRLMFLDPDAATMTRLENLLRSYTEEQEKAGKKKPPAA